MSLPRSIALLSLPCAVICAAACVPRLNGLCTSDAQCRAGEACAGGGFCVPREALVDPTLPVISGVQVDTPAPDGIDADGVGWFRGPSNGPSAQYLQLSAVLTTPESVIQSATATLPDGTAVPGSQSPSSGRWTFLVPNRIGAAPAGAVTLHLDAQTAAGKHPAAPASYVLHFDDSPGSSFTPAIANDGAWYARAAGAAVSVAVSFPARPPSGFRSLALRVNGQTTDVLPAAASGQAATFALPTTAAAAGSEGPLGFKVTATSVVGESASAPGSRLVDDAPPQVLATSVLYPPKLATDPLAFGHDGSHFNVRDFADLVKFSVYDCGSGIPVPSGLTSFAIDTQPKSAAPSLATSSATTTCANGRTVPVYTVTVTADLATQTAASPSFTSAARVTATVRDAASAAHLTTASALVAQTRALWATANVGAQWLAAGPALFATGTGGLNRIDKLNGQSQQWSKAASPIPPVIGASGGTATVFWGDSILHSADATSTTVPAATGISSCGGFGTPTGLLLGDAATAIGSGYNTKCSWDCTNCATTCLPGCRTCIPYAEYSNAMLKPGSPTAACTTTGLVFPQSIDSGSAVGRNSTLFQMFTDQFNGGVATKLTASPVSGGTTPTASATLTSGSSLLITDNGAGADRVLLNDNGTGKGYDYSGSAFASGPLGAATPKAATSSLLAANAAGAFGLYNLKGGPVSTSFGPQAAALSAGGAFVLAGSGSPPSLQIRPAGGVDTLNGALPAGPVTDLVQAANGILYVASGGAVYAVVTDLPGMDIGTPAAPLWPGAARDACKSSNLAYTCPY